MVFIPATELHPATLAGLYESFSVHGHTFEEFAGELLQGNLQVYVVFNDHSHTYLAVAVLGEEGKKVLQLAGLWVAPQSGSGPRFKTWITALRMLADSWNCDTIETTVRDVKQVTALSKFGAKIKDVTVVLETTNGQ